MSNTDWQQKKRENIHPTDTADQSTEIPPPDNTNTPHMLDTQQLYFHFSYINIVSENDTQSLLQLLGLTLSNTMIPAFGGHIPHYGICELMPSHHCHYKLYAFHVVNSAGPAILGLPTCCDMKLVTLNCGISTPQTETVCMPNPQGNADAKSEVLVLLTLVGAEENNSLHFQILTCAVHQQNRLNISMMGITSDNGVIKPHSLSFYSFAFNSAADLPVLISTDQVKVTPVCEAVDGTALKPGLEFDPQQQKVLGLVNPLQPRMFTNNTIPEPKEIKDKLITCAEVIYATTLDKYALIPFGLWYRPKSVSGKEMLQSIQKCERQYKHVNNV